MAQYPAKTGASGRWSLQDQSSHTAIEIRQEFGTGGSAWLRC